MDAKEFGIHTFLRLIFVFETIKLYVRLSWPIAACKMDKNIRNAVY